MSKKENCCPEKVDALINHQSTKFSEEHREWLNTFSNEELESMLPKMERRTEIQLNVESVQSYLKDMKSEDVVAILPEALQTVITAHEAEKAEKRKVIVEKIMAVHKDVWTAEELNIQSDEQLAKLEKTLPVVDAEVDETTDYTVNGATGNAPESPSGEILLPPGVKIEK